MDFSRSWLKVEQANLSRGGIEGLVQRHLLLEICMGMTKGKDKSA